MITSLRLSLRSCVGTMVCQPTFIGKADIASIADDEMVKDPNAQYLPCRHQSRRQDTIFLARRRITTADGCAGRSLPPRILLPRM